MMPLEQLTLRGATTLLSYLQHHRLENEDLGAIALAGTLCELLNQLDLAYPGVSENFGWERTLPTGSDGSPDNKNSSGIAGDRYSNFSSRQLS